MCGHHKKQTQSRHCPRHTVKYVRHQSSDSGSESDCQNECTFSTYQGETVTVLIGNVPVTMLIDSGSTCNIINTEYTKRSSQGRVSNCLHATARSIGPYSSPPIRVHQLIRSNVTLEDGNAIGAYFLAIEKPPLHFWARRLRSR